MRLISGIQEVLHAHYIFPDNELSSNLVTPLHHQIPYANEDRSKRMAVRGRVQKYVTS